MLARSLKPGCGELLFVRESKILGSERAGIRRPCLTDDEEESRQYTTKENFLHLQGLFARALDRCAITFEDWTSADQRKYLGITMHYITSSLHTATILLDMVLIEGECQTGEYLLINLSKVPFFWCCRYIKCRRRFGLIYESYHQILTRISLFIRI